MSMKRKRSINDYQTDYNNNKMRITEDMIEELRKLSLIQNNFQPINFEQPLPSQQPTSTPKINVQKEYIPDIEDSHKLLNMYKSNYALQKSLSPKKFETTNSDSFFKRNLQLILYQEPVDLISNNISQKKPKKQENSQEPDAMEFEE
jgi:hypothetical protein